MADALTLAYLAGIIDADGYVSIRRFARVQGFYYSAGVGIAGTRDDPHRLAASVFGGRVTQHPNGPHRPQFHWSRSGAGAAEVLSALLPHLRIKRPQALLALRLHEHVQQLPRTPEALAEREAMRHEMMFVLNEVRSRVLQMPA